MNIQETIEKAIEGGYKGDKHFLINLPEYAKSQIWLDPLFWQSLSKAMRWKKWTWVSWKDSWSNLTQMQATNDDDFSPNWPNGSCRYSWVYQWHRFIDHLADGGTPESFFKNL